jgi:hypothetical protein
VRQLAGLAEKSHVVTVIVCTTNIHDRRNLLGGENMLVCDQLGTLEASEAKEVRSNIEQHENSFLRQSRGQ